MALIPSTLSALLMAAFSGQYEGTQSAEQLSAQQSLCDDLASAIDTYIKTGNVSTTVTGTAGPYPVVGSGTGAIT